MVARSIIPFLQRCSCAQGAVLAFGKCADGRSGIRGRLTALQHHEIVGMGEIENGAGARIERVGVEALGPEPRDIPLEAVLSLLQPGELPSEHFLAALEIGARFETMLAG